MDEVQTLRSARAAIEKGDKGTARKLLLQVIQANPRHETAWLWLSALVGDPKRERECLQRVLAINPQNAVARRHLDLLDQQAAPVVPPAAAAGDTLVQPSPSATPKRKRTVVIALAAIAATLCLCVGACLVFGGWGAVTGIIRGMREHDDVAVVLDQFMRHMERKEASTAFALFSQRAQRQVDLSELEAATKGHNYALFEGYESLAIRHLGLKAALNTNPDLPQGTIAEVSAAVTYRGGFVGTLTAVLEKEDGVWRLHGFNIVVPPDKIASP